MKKCKWIVIFLLVGLLIASLVTAEEADEIDYHEHCLGFSKSAEMIMELRQRGAAMSDLILVYGTLAGQTDTWTRMIELAYETPQYRTQKLQQQAIDEFREMSYQVCMQEFLTKRSE